MSSDSQDGIFHRQRRPAPPGGWGFGSVRWGKSDARTPIQVSQLELALPRLPGEFDGFRIAQVSDLHFGRFTTPSFVRRVVELALQQHPDLAVLCGDTVDRPSPDRGQVVELLEGLFRAVPTFAVPGNHEYYGNADPLWRRLTEAGMHLLVNQHQLIRHPPAQAGQAAIALVGMDDLKRGWPDFQAALEGIPPGTFTMLLGHSPDLADEVPPEARIDLMLAGHTHGGQVRLFGRAIVTETRNRRYTGGLVRAPGFPMYVSRGLGATGLPLRVGADPELPILTLRRQEARQEECDRG